MFFTSLLLDYFFTKILRVSYLWEMSIKGRLTKSMLETLHKNLISVSESFPSDLKSLSHSLCTSIITGHSTLKRPTGVLYVKSEISNKNVFLYKAIKNVLFLKLPSFSTSIGCFGVELPYCWCWNNFILNLLNKHNIWCRVIHNLKFPDKVDAGKHHAFSKPSSFSFLTKTYSVFFLLFVLRGTRITGFV